MTLRELLDASPYQGYAYSYPHKMAYRDFSEPLRFRDVWADENLADLFLYLHIPFCEMRCGFCNLFTTTNPKDGLVARYLGALDTQFGVVAEELSSGGKTPGFGRGAVGGGTPTFLTCSEIEQLFGLIRRHFGELPEGMPLSFEMSPGTIEADKLRLLRDLGVTRASIGIQSFLPEERKALGRPGDETQTLEALSTISAAGFPVFNIDLIYGVEGQTVETWLKSIEAALEFGVQELFLYPLYVRPLTGLGRRDGVGDEAEELAGDRRLELYRAGRDLLLSRGFRQVSMRLFRSADSPSESGQYCCQEDGMLGLGVGARSYSTDIHYSSEYAVGKAGVLGIVEDFVNRASDKNRLREIDYGIEIPVDEQRRRYLIKSLLRSDGFDAGDFHAHFGDSESDNPEDRFPQLAHLRDAGLVIREGSVWQLTAEGFERSDAIGPWLYSDDMVELMRGFELV